jgi:hypothetical protein
MISSLLAKLYGIIMEKKIVVWLEIHGKEDRCVVRKPWKRAKG